jgi:hypothetical protein
MDFLFLKYCGETQKIGLYLIPTPALPGSGSMGMISARSVKAPLMFSAKLKVKSEFLIFNF